MTYRLRYESRCSPKPNCIRKTRYGENDFQYGGWNSFTLQCGTWLCDDKTLNSRGGSTLQCCTWLQYHDIESAKWQHPAMWLVALGPWHWICQVAARGMWHVARGSWHWIRQVAAPCNVARGSHWIRPNVRHIGNLLPVSISTISPQ